VSVRHRVLLLLGIVALVVPLSSGAQPAASSANATGDSSMQPELQDDQAAIDGGKKWLELIDSGRFGDAWDATAKYLKSSVTRSEWVNGLTDIRKPFGKLVSRTPAKFARAHSIPGAPDGDYVVIQYDSVFATGKNASEQLTLMLEADNSFRVSGYFIR
jgi:hypothetical protein